MQATFTASGSAGVVNDITLANIPGFGMCQSPANPQVVAATAAAGGIVTPAVCIPAIFSPWSAAADGSQVDGAAAIDASSVCACGWGGQITISG